MLGLTILAALGLLWEVVVRTFHVPAFLLPPPSAVLSEFATRPTLYFHHAKDTLLGALLGLVVATIAGIAIGTVIVYSWVLRGIVYPVILVLQTVPKVALAPLFVIWIGYGLDSRVAMAALIAFFPVVMSTITGLSSVERDLVDLIRMLNGSRLQQFIKVAFPHAMPFIFSGLRVAVALSVIGEVVAEFVAGNTGLGYIIIVANAEVNVAMSFAALMLLAGMGMTLFGLMELVERLAIPWSVEESRELFT